jgi:multidrug efflux pump
MAFSRFFIDRPIFAWVIAIIIMLAGAIAATGMPIGLYPNIAPPSVRVSARYTGADPDTLQNAVTQVIEQQLAGLDNLLYFGSTSSADGSVAITVTFAAGTDPDTAQVQVQNKVQQAIPQLPTEVQQQGITVAKSQAAQILVVALYDVSGRYTSRDISDYLVSTLQDPLSRVTGVAEVRVFGTQYAMRIWLDPYKLQSFSLMPSDVRAAVLAQNVQVSAGALGAQPVVEGQELNVTVTAQSRLQSVAEFEDIVLKSSPGGATVRLRDVARVELGSDAYVISSMVNGYPASGLGILPTPGANALEMVEEAKRRVALLEPKFPPGLKLNYVVDTTQFIRQSIAQVVETLVEAILLVILVMYLFMQSWRTTLVPAIAVPVVLLGTLGILSVAGYSINTLTLFALVLSIGLLVDDAIVVAENVERVMREKGLGAREATLRSMEEITGALIGIGLVLTAVFLPMAFFGGSTGVIYRQFSVTIVSAMALSILCALVLTPALCATLLRPLEKPAAARPSLRTRFFAAFNRGFEATRNWYGRRLDAMMRWRKAVMAIYAVIVAVLGWLFWIMPTGFLPTEDQGTIITQVVLPPGTVQARTIAVTREIIRYFKEKDLAPFTFAIAGSGGAAQSSAGVWEHLPEWHDRPKGYPGADFIARRTTRFFSKTPDARIYSNVPPSVQELGNATGFDIQMQDRGNLGHARFMKERDRLLELAAKNPLLFSVRASGLDDGTQLHLKIDKAKANALGISLSDANATLSAAWGGTFLNNFIDRGRIKRVYMQGEAPFRMDPEDLGKWHVRTREGEMAPFTSFATMEWVIGPAVLTRYNGFPSLQIQGQPAPGVSTGTALKEMDKLFKQLSPGIDYELTGLSLQEAQSGEQAPLLYALSALIIYLCLAALYESWLIPVPVMMVIPLGMIGAVLAVMARGMFNDIYFQVGLLTIIGLSAKNAILIVEFAAEAWRHGTDARQAALDAARMRLRPILMTSVAFVAGVTPLAIATGAGAASQNDIGTGVIGGMITGTVLAVFFVPVFFALVSNRKAPPRTAAPQT